MARPQYPKIEGKIDYLEQLHQFGVISYEQMQRLMEPLKQQLKELQAKYSATAAAAGGSEGDVATGAAA